MLNLIDRRKLIELDSHLLSLNIAAEQQQSIISHWESRNNRVYGKSRDSSTYRSGMDYQVDEIDDEIGKRILSYCYYLNDINHHLKFVIKSSNIICIKI